MALKKSQLYRSLWQSCDELRGGMDASQYKDYILTLLFVKYVSDKYARDPYGVIEVPDGASFDDLVRLKGNSEIGDQINKRIRKLAEANKLKDVINLADFNDETKLGDGKEMVDRLSKLVGIFEGLDFRANRALGDDLLGDAYEYLMRHFATESGKSKGQFYTPAEVSRVMAQIIGIERAAFMIQPTVYDPTCGSGSLLIKAADVAATDTLAIFGQERDVATRALAVMNMILHGHEGAEIARGNTLTKPLFTDPQDGSLKRFDFAVANPPFSDKSWSSGLNPSEDEFKRFAYGIPPNKNGDFAFLLHFVSSLKSTGTGAIILPHGVLFRGNREADIRRELVERGLIKGIIGLPANLFYGTGIPAAVIVIDKGGAASRDSIFMLDSSRGFVKDGNKNRLREQDIRKIVETFNGEIELAGYSRRVPVREIADPKNEYNLNLPRYIDSSEPEDLHSLDAHLNGGIPTRDIDDLNEFWTVFPTLRPSLFRPSRRPSMSEARIPMDQVKHVILDHAEFQSYSAQVNRVVEEWKRTHAPMLYTLSSDDIPSEVVEQMGDELLARFRAVPLLNRFDVYQQLMSYWEEMLQDDLYLIVADGWTTAAQPRPPLTDASGKTQEQVDLKVGRKKYVTDLLPPSVVIARYLQVEQAEVEQLQSAVDAAGERFAEFVEEQSGDESVLEEVTNDKGNITKGAVKTQIKCYKNDPEFAEEVAVLQRYLDLYDAESSAKNALKSAHSELEQNTFAIYGRLDEAAVKELVIEDKWFAHMRQAVEREIQRVIQRLVGRVQELETRYEQPLPELSKAVYERSERVEAHLREMGVEWSV